MARWTERERAEFEALRETYLAEIPARILAIREATAAASRGATSPPALQEVRDLAHRLVGSSAIFGLKRLSAAARDLEDCAIASIEDAAELRGLDELVAALEAAWNEGAEARSDDGDR
jgi:HPt (histidine-containing phosphotransfer) domain-containing protein